MKYFDFLELYMSHHEITFEGTDPISTISFCSTISCADCKVHTECLRIDSVNDEEFNKFKNKYIEHFI